jgi:tRNA-dihydrouridine synthase
VDVSGVVGSVKGTIYNGDIWTYEDIKITATVYDLQGNPVMSESTHIPRLAPNISHNFTIAKALGKDPSRKWERVVWDLNFRNKKIGFVEEVLLEMPSQQQEIWANIIYSHNTFTVNLWPTIFDMDRQLAELAIQR